MYGIGYGYTGWAAEILCCVVYHSRKALRVVVWQRLLAMKTMCGVLYHECRGLRLVMRLCILLYERFIYPQTILVVVAVDYWVSMCNG
jgi:hypothetical protein